MRDQGLWQQLTFLSPWHFLLLSVPLLTPECLGSSFLSPSLKPFQAWVLSFLQQSALLVWLSDPLDGRSYLSVAVMS